MDASGITQVIMATHAPILMAYPNAQILLIDAAGIKPVKYTETEHYVVTRDFLNRHEKFIRELVS